MSMWSLPSARDAARRRSSSPSGRMMTFVMLMPRSSGGGAPVMVARRPPSTSVLSASASPPPRSVRGSPNARRSRGVPCPACPLGVVIVDDDVRAERHHPRRAALARGRDHPGAAVRRELDDHPAGDAAGAVDQDRFTGLNVERLGHHLLSRQRGNGERSRLCPGGVAGLLGHQACWGDQPLGPAALVGQRERMCHHGCAGGGPLDPRADPDDLACGLDAESQGRDAPDVPTAGANELVPVRHAGSLDLDQHLPGFQRRRLRQLEKRHVVAERLDAGGSQAHARIIARSGSPRLAPDGRGWPAVVPVGRRSRSRCASRRVRLGLDTTAFDNGPYDDQRARSVRVAGRSNTRPAWSSGATAAAVRGAARAARGISTSRPRSLARSQGTAIRRCRLGGPLSRR